jgi:hypothetical protein
LFICSVLFTLHGYSQLKEYTVDRFNKVIVSPHISVTFVKGDSESVTIHSSTEPLEAMNVEVSGKTLHLYLDNAKTTTKREKVEMDGWSEKRAIYDGTVVQATVTYQVLDELSLRGEERFECKSPIEQSKFSLTIYGESEVYLEEVRLDTMNTTVYGESLMEISSGSIGRQKITAYGETRINTAQVSTVETKITAYGEGTYRIAAEDRLKVTCYGEATVEYVGSPDIDKGIIIGETTIRKIE